jgi:hypothetical protein
VQSKARVSLPLAGRDEGWGWNDRVSAMPKQVLYRRYAF